MFWGPNTNTNIIRVPKNDRIRIRILFGFPKLTEYEYEYYSGFQKWPNTNTNIIRLPKNDRIRIRILFGFPKIINYEYKYRSPSQKWLNYSLISGPAKELFLGIYRVSLKKRSIFVLCVYIYICSKNRKLPFHMRVGIRISSLIQIATQIISIRNPNCPKTQKVHGIMQRRHSSSFTAQSWDINYIRICIFCVFRAIWILDG